MFQSFRLVLEGKYAHALVKHDPEASAIYD